MPMKADSAVVIHAEHRFTGSLKRRQDMLSQEELTAYFWTAQSFALSAMAVIAAVAACTMFSRRSSSANTAWNGGRTNSLRLVKR